MIVLYSTGCPKCRILEKKLNDKKIEYEICDDVNMILDKNFMSVPMLEVNNKVMDFGEAVKWVNAKEEISDVECASCEL